MKNMFMNADNNRKFCLGCVKNRYEIFIQIYKKQSQMTTGKKYYTQYTYFHKMYLLSWTKK